MNNFKRFLSVVLAILLVVIGFCGCEDNPSESSSADNNSISASELETSSKPAEETSSILETSTSSKNNTSSATPPKEVSSNTTSVGSKETEVNDFGNTVGNINNNHGIAAAQGEWVYFTTDKGIYKTNHSKSYLLVEDTALTLNVYGDWVYYRMEGTGDFYRVKTDGTGKELFLKKISMMYIVKGKVYYCEEGGDTLYSMNTDKTDKKLVIKHEDIRHNLNITEDKIYWGNNIDVCVANIDGSGFCKYSNAYSQQMVIYKGKKYTTGTLCKSNIDGTDEVELNGAGSMQITIQDDWIYFISSHEDGCVYKIRTDGTDKQLLTEYSSINICVLGDWIYFQCFDNGLIRKARMKTDGSQMKFFK